MSFLDLAYARLGIDPVEAGCGSSTVTTSPSPRPATRPAARRPHPRQLGAVRHQARRRRRDAADEPVVILQRLGTPDEAIIHTTWAELDRTVEADHLTVVYIPALASPVAAESVRFHQLARTLREQCPWDIEQTHQSLVRYLIEETYELVDALEALDADDPATDEHLIEELGDLLYQIEFHATIAEQQGRFTMADVARGVHDKLVRRHPHVFGTSMVDGTETVLAQLGRRSSGPRRSWADVRGEVRGRIRRHPTVVPGPLVRRRGPEEGRQGGLRLA